MPINTISNSGTSSPLPGAPQGASGATVKAPVVVPEPASQPPSNNDVQQAVASIKQLVEANAPNSLQFSIDNETGKTIVRVTDVQTGEMIRQIPSEELLDIARSLDKLQGMLFKQKV